MQNSNYILELLVRQRMISPSDAEEVRTSAEKQGTSIIEEIKNMGLATEFDILRVQADEAGLPILEEMGDVQEEALKALPRDVAVRYGVIPIDKDANILRLAISDPNDIETLDALNNILRYEIETIVVPREKILEAIEKNYQKKDSTENDAPTVMGVKASENEEISEADAPIIACVNGIITEAYRLRSSDIHIEPLDKRLRLRYRIDGELQEMKDIDKRIQSSIISRLKIMSRMSIAEKRLPQDGRIQLELDDEKKIDLRVSTVPTVHGESIVMRILDKSTLLLGLPDLGFFSDDEEKIQRTLGFSDGIFLVTGPTGSGKTTTLYACLNSINRPDTKIITVEDPVEYQLNGINQVPVNEEVGMTFATALRSMLRQAPNIIMIGEIRDLETATIAINASLTGHLVFSTLHTNDAPSAISRLVDIGVKPFLVASSIRGIMAQRLVRKVCPECAEPYQPEETELKALNLSPEKIEKATFRRGKGCKNCRGTGYRGRIGIFEVLILDDEMRSMINDNMPTSTIRSRVRSIGVKTLREDGVRKVLSGLTTLEELIKTTASDED